jgi:hypothetical protein
MIYQHELGLSVGIERGPESIEIVGLFVSLILVGFGDFGQIIP